MGDKEKVVRYKKPLFEKAKGLELADQIMELYNKGRFCNCSQCSGCHGCR